jgi:hypothetical protein
VFAVGFENERIGTSAGSQEDQKPDSENDRLASSKSFTKKLYLFYSQFTDFGPQYLGLSSTGQRLQSSDTNSDADMFTKAIMSALMAGIAFYVRFLVVLWTESRPRLSGYWVRLRRGSGEDVIAELQERKKPETRAA